METAEMNRILTNLPPDPKGLKAAIRQDIPANTYIIYSRKENVAVCTRCGKTLKVTDEMRHNQNGICPKCGNHATYKSKGIGRQGLNEYVRILVLTRKGKTVYGQLKELTINFVNFGKPEYDEWLSALYIFKSNEQHYYKHVYDWCFGPEGWTERKTVKLPTAYKPIGYYYGKFEETYMYCKNLKSVFDNSCLKNLYCETSMRAINCNPYYMIRYISIGLKHQSVELLAKAGFCSLIQHRLDNARGYRAINWRGKDLRKILKLNLGDIRKLPRDSVTPENLKVFQTLSSKDRCLPWEQIKLVRYPSSFGGVIEEYIEENIGWRNFISYCARSQSLIHPYDYIDYIEACKTLGIDIRKKRIMFPEDLLSAHDVAMSRLSAKANEAVNEMLKKITKKVDFSAENENLILLLAKTQEDLNMESAVLGHCVRTYGDRMAKGKTLIFFIREKSQIDQPYYTLEILPDGQFIQCRGKNNCDMTAEVKEFQSYVVKEFNRYLRNKNKEEAA